MHSFANAVILRRSRRIWLADVVFRYEGDILFVCQNLRFAQVDKGWKG